MPREQEQLEELMEDMILDLEQQQINQKWDDYIKQLAIKEEKEFQRKEALRKHDMEVKRAAERAEDLEREVRKKIESCNG